MEQMKLRIYITCFLSSLLLLSSTKQAKACGFYETKADYQAMMFRAMLPGMKCMQPFTYTMKSIYYEDGYALNSDPEENDRYRNCMEWLAACDKTVTIDDIYKIQYRTDGILFIKAYQKNTWEIDFTGNTFVKFLIQPKNKDLLDYMLFAKEMELTEVGSSNSFEKWDHDGYYHNNEANKRTDKEKLFNTAKEKLKEPLSVFLKNRYAFQVCRLAYQVGNYYKATETYNKYFGKIDKNNLMSVWATLFTAMSISDTESERYRYLLQVFDNSDEKKMRCVQLYDSIGFTYTSLFSGKEQSIVNVIKAIRNPGRALDLIQNAYSLDKNSKHIPFLILREINKLEDWLITPLFYKKFSYTYSNPFRCAYKWQEEGSNNSDELGDKLQNENLTSDMQYIAQLKSLIENILSTSNGETKDFYAISLAHLSLLQKNVPDARKYLAMISSKANPSIQLQKKLETIWLAIKTQDIESDAFKKTFLENITDLEKIPTTDHQQMFYTLTLSLTDEYLKKGNRVYGNLMHLKSDIHQYSDGSWYESYRTGDSYYSLRYFDKNATVKDMDALIGLIEKTNKTPFEEYLTAQPLSTTNAYKDLKGTIAFRNNDLQTAYTTFASMPKDYWYGNNFSFGSYLNEDPFIPKGLKANEYRKFDYKFNKADFVKELIGLQGKIADNKENNATYYNKLGDAYFNTSYWGNSWMMINYAWSSSDTYYTKTDCLPQWMQNYMTAGIAREYYEKALNNASDNEQRAYASVMLHYIHRLSYSFRGTNSDKMMALQYRNTFMEYNKTQTFNMYECPGIKYFMAHESVPD